MASELTRHGRVPATPSEESIADRLREARAEIEQLEQHLRGATRRRDLLILKLATAGFAERVIGPIAGVSFVRVNQIKARAAARAEGSDGEPKVKDLMADLEASLEAARSFAKAMKDRGIHVGLGTGTEVRCAACGDPWPCAGADQEGRESDG